MPIEYTRNELKILWHLKRQGGSITCQNPAPGTRSLMNNLSSVLDIRVATVRYSLRNLERQCILIRTYGKAVAPSFQEAKGYNPLIKIELCDPGMWLPELPAPPPLAVVVAEENEELYRRTVHEPSPEAVIIALLERNEELRKQIDKLHQIVTDQQAEIETHQKTIERVNRRPRIDHLTNRLQDALTPDQWDRLQH